MADISPGVALAQTLDARNTRTLQRVERTREIQRDAQSNQDDGAQASQSTADSQSTSALSAQRGLDSEQYQRERQLTADLQASQARQDDARAQAADQASAPQPRGSLVDLLA